nr:helix-turn-helix transcriptional regulator [Olsenella timonensis]
MERGASEPSTTNLVKVARLYGVDPAELLREVEG